MADSIKILSCKKNYFDWDYKKMLNQVVEYHLPVKLKKGVKGGGAKNIFYYVKK